MVIKLNKKLEIFKVNEDVILPKNILQKIERFWEEQLKSNSHLFNGEVWSVTRFEKVENKIILTIKRTSYAHYLYDERIGLEGEYACYNLNGGILLETLDKKYIVGEMNETTSYPKGLQITGGNLDQNDVKNDGTTDLVGNIARELKEELNLDLFDENVIKTYEMKYMEIPEGKRHSYSPIIKGLVNKTESEIKKHYEEYKKYLQEKDLEVEFSKLYFINKKNVKKELDELKNPKRPYLRDLLFMDSTRI